MGTGGLDILEAADRSASSQIAAALPLPLLLVGPRLEIRYVNPAAEQFFAMGAGLLVRQRLTDVTPFASPLIQIIGQARERGASISEHGFLKITSCRTAMVSARDRIRWICTMVLAARPSALSDA